MIPITSVLKAAKFMPADWSIKALGKINPKLKNYFSKAASYGFATNSALDYLTERFGNPNQQTYENTLDQEAAQGTLRPDEAVSRSEIANSKIPGKALKSAVSFASGGLLGGDEEPSRGKPRSPMSSESLGEDVEGMQNPQPSQPNPQAAGAIAKDFPQVLQHLQRQLDAGMDLQTAARNIQASKSYGPIVRKMEQESGVPFLDWVSNYFGSKQAQGQQQGPQQSQAKQQIAQGMSQLAQALQGLKR